MQSLEQVQGPGGPVKAAANSSSASADEAEEEQRPMPVKKAAPRKTRSRKAS
jgi:hypothetical protein